MRMAMKKTGIYGAAGIIVAVLIIAGILLSGIKVPGFYNIGTLVVKLTDAPVECARLRIGVSP